MRPLLTFPAWIALGTISSFAAAPNDDFTGRIPINGVLPLSVTADATGSSYEAMEPEARPCDEAGSLWWTWTAPADGWIHAQPSGTAVRAAVFEGHSLETLAAPYLDSFTQARTTVRGSIQWYARTGMTYAIALHAIRPGMAALHLRRVNFLSGKTLKLEGPAPLSITSRSPGRRIPGTQSAIGRTYTTPDDNHWQWIAPVAGSYTVRVQFDESELYSTPLPTVRISTLTEAVSPPPILGVATHTVHLEAGGILLIKALMDEGPCSVSITPAPPLPDPPGDLPSVALWRFTGTLNWRAPAAGQHLFSASGPIPFMVSGAGLANDAFSHAARVISVTSGGLYTVQSANPVPLSPAATFWIEPLRAPMTTGNDGFYVPANFGNASPARSTAVDGSLSISGPPFSRWWTWTAPATGPAECAADEMEATGTLDVLTGDDPAALVTHATGKVQFVFELPHRYNGVLPFHAIGGQTYRLKASPRNKDPFLVSVRAVTVRDHSSPALALDLGSALPAFGRAAFVHGPDGPRSAWWKWIAPKDATVYLESNYSVGGGSGSSSPIPSLTFFKGALPDPLNGIVQPGAPRGWNLPSRYAVNAGETYWIQVTRSGFPSYHGLTIFEEKFQPPPNDDYANRLPLEPEGYNQTGHYLYHGSGQLLLASIEPGEQTLYQNVPGSPGAGWEAGLTGSTWWKIIPAESGIYTFYQEGDYQEPSAFVLGRGEDLASFVPLSRSFSDDAVKFGLRAGVEYAIGIARNPFEPYSYGWYGLAYTGPEHDGSYDDWITRYSLAKPADELPMANPSGDGYPNFVKYALGLDPTQNSGPDGTDPAKDNAPVLTDAGTHVELRCVAPNAYPFGNHVWIFPETSRDLLVWAQSNEVEMMSLEGSAFVLRLPKTAEKRFLRLRFQSEGPPPDPND